MTIEQKTDNLLEKLIYCDFRTEIDIDKAKRLIRVALKKQDRDTRHACAEAMMTLPEKYTIDGDDGYVDVNQAHNIIMNCRGGTI